MKYSVYARETFKGGPTAKEDLNFEISAVFYNLEDVLDYMEREIKFLYTSKDRRVLKELTEMEEGKVIKKFLMERVGRHGRVLRVYRIENLHVQTRYEDFELI